MKVYIKKTVNIKIYSVFFTLILPLCLFSTPLFAEYPFNNFVDLDLTNPNDQRLARGVDIIASMKRYFNYYYYGGHGVINRAPDLVSYIGYIVNQEVMNQGYEKVVLFHCYQGNSKCPNHMPILKELARQSEYTGWTGEVLLATGAQEGIVNRGPGYLSLDNRKLTPKESWRVFRFDKGSFNEIPVTRRHLTEILPYNLPSYSATQPQTSPQRTFTFTPQTAHPGRSPSTLRGFQGGPGWLPVSVAASDIASNFVPEPLAAPAALGATGLGLSIEGYFASGASQVMSYRQFLNGGYHMLKPLAGAGSAAIGAGVLPFSFIKRHYKWWKEEPVRKKMREESEIDTTVPDLIDTRIGKGRYFNPDDTGTFSICN